MGYALPPRPCGGGHIERCAVTNPSVRLPWTSRSSSSCLARAPEGPRRSLSELRPLQGLATAPLACHRFRDARAHTGLPGFRPLRRSQMAASTSAATHAAPARVCLARYVPSPGPLTLLTVYSATTPAGLFHPARALGVPPFRAYSRRAGTPLDARCPPDVAQGRLSPAAAAPSSRAGPWSERGGVSVRIAGSRLASPSGLCSLRRPGTSSQRFRPRRARKLSWACSSSGVDRSAAHPAFHARQLPWASRRCLPSSGEPDFGWLRATGPAKHTTAVAGALSLEIGRPS